MFDTWRGTDGVLHHDLAVTWKVTVDEVQTLMKRIQPYAILAARVVFNGEASAELIEIVEQAEVDERLVQRAAELQTPKTIEHDRFGTLTLDRRLDWYRTTTLWAGQLVRLNFAAQNDAQLQAALQTAVALWDDQTTWNERIQIYAVHELLDLKNESWLEADEAELSAEDFQSRMTLEDVSVYPAGKFEFWHDDGDMFGGHAILIAGNLQEGLNHASTPG